ncbi:MAG: hypothetical protein JWO68_2404 [Actinomycetia bacterium]|nr:hypothetical protein [Actinomycetes bacterium]
MFTSLLIFAALLGAALVFAGDTLVPQPIATTPASRS